MKHETLMSKQALTTLIFLGGSMATQLSMIFVMGFVDFKYFSVPGFFLIPHVLLFVLAIYVTIKYCCKSQPYLTI